MQLTRLRPIAFVALLAGVLLPGAAPALAVDPVEVVFSNTDAEQSWTVPADVTSIHVVVTGAPGGQGFSGRAGGSAATVIGDLSVIAGTTLFVEVGGKGANGSIPTGGPGGFNGGADGGDSVDASGGGGGGASDIRGIARSQPGSAASRLIVAAGGGGGGAATSAGGGQGGFADAAGKASNGGAGGGGAGTSSTGGGGGPGVGEGLNGLDGTGAAGGEGGFGSTAGGGGGGGGYFGGGGGGGTSSSTMPGSGGGGGGSSFVGDAANASVSTAATSTPSITITYTPGATPPDPTSGPDTGVVDAEVTVPTSAACVELSTTAVSFGTQRFGSVDVQADPSIRVTNCSGTDETLLAHATSAGGNGATWNLVDDAGTCDAGTLETDAFHLKLRRPSNEVDPVTQLSNNNKQIAELTGGAETSVDALLDMPCPGSEGAGQTMGMNIVFVVTDIE